MSDDESKPVMRSGVGMPAHLWLDQFGSYVWDAFGTNPYLVGSALTGPRPPRDVDVRLILDDEDYDRLFPDLASESNRTLASAELRDAKWVALCLAFATFGQKLTGLPIDFQIQKLTYANEIFDGHPRSALGLVAARYIRSKP